MMVFRQFLMPATIASGLMVVSALLVTGPGCGSTAPEVDKRAVYTPESIAQELAFRYRALNPDARKSSRSFKSKATKSIAQLESAEKLQTKGKDVATTKKRSGAATLDTVLEDVNAKLDLLHGIARGEACQKMIETLSQDKSLSESDKALLTEKLKELAGAS
jgi:hypothetical protein